MSLSPAPPSDPKAALVSAVGRADAFAPYLRTLASRYPGFTEQALTLTGGEEVNALLALADAAASPYCPAAQLGATLRLRRAALSYLLAIGDLAGLLPVETVMQTLSDFADRAVDLALADAIEARTGVKGLTGFAVLALGKWGGGELNYSSDIDPIFLFDSDTLPQRRRDDPADTAQRIARRAIDTLSERTEHGFVFRVDMRLRPASEVSPLALPFDLAVHHYESAALTWEQAAFIRARNASGDTDLGGEFLSQIGPFIWRRSLDFHIIDEIGRLTRRIREQPDAQVPLGPGFDLKRGRGGIREIEFFAQSQQLVHGGRNADLRVRAVLPALEALARAQIVGREEADALARHYRLLRTVEHRLQMVGDQQTHSLPDHADALDAVAQLHGLADGAALIAALQPGCDETAAIYASLIDQHSLATRSSAAGQGDAADGALPDDAPALIAALAALGFAKPEDAAERITRWRGGAVRAIAAPAARRAFEAALPRLMQALGAAPDPAHALARLDQLLRALPGAMNFFTLLLARPALADLLADILSHAPALADALARRSNLLDGLISARAFDPLPPVGEVRTMLMRAEPDADYEQRLDLVRARVAETRFALGVQLIAGHADPLDVASGYARLAEAAVQGLAAATIAEYEAVHGRVPGGELLILALGRLGGGALTHASDLDLVFLFTGDHGTQSDGARPLGATRYFNRLAQRIVTALSVPTASGALYEVDTRLRPSGGQGLLAVSVDSFLRYQNEAAWTWEHMALCRARPVFGSDAACQDLADAITAFLKSGHDPALVRARASAMRAEMAAHKPGQGVLDAKLRPGGLVDLEFVLHTLQLSTGKGISPSLPEVLAILIAAGLLDPALMEAHDRLTRLLLVSRLVAPDGADPPQSSRALIAQLCGAADWDNMLEQLEQARHIVTQAFAAHVGAPDARS